MSKFIVLSNLLLFCSLSVFTTTFVFNRNVYICKGKKSERYHLDKNCRGLKNCSTNIYTVSHENARKIGRTLCGWED